MTRVSARLGMTIVASIEQCAGADNIPYVCCGQLRGDKAGSAGELSLRAGWTASEAPRGGCCAERRAWCVRLVGQRIGPVRRRRRRVHRTTSPKQGKPSGIFFSFSFVAVHAPDILSASSQRSGPDCSLSSRVGSGAISQTVATVVRLYRGRPVWPRFAVYKPLRRDRRQRPSQQHLHQATPRARSEYLFSRGRFPERVPLAWLAGSDDWMGSGTEADERPSV